MDPKRIAKNDQAMAVIIEFCIPNLRSFYVACIKEEFNETEALSLTIELMKMMLFEEEDKKDES